ncbi:MAG TPA: hypothetical protein EYG72_00965 [Candidatus Pacebacteria bacterium]|nr:hypothetical protein [Candidatus Paceibacterota bacterium]
MMYFYITIIIVLIFVIYLQFDLKFEIKLTKSSFSKNIAFSGVKTTLKAYWEKKVILPINLSYDGDDQFHWKLETNSLAMSVMNKEEREKYELDLMNARNRIINKSLPEEDKTVAYTGVYKR